MVTLIFSVTPSSLVASHPKSNQQQTLALCDARDTKLSTPVRNLSSNAHWELPDSRMHRRAGWAHCTASRSPNVLAAGTLFLFMRRERAELKVARKTTRKTGVLEKTNQGFE